MANISKINVGGVNYDIQDITSGYSKIEISNLLSSGIALGTITLNDQSYIIYAPNTSTDTGGLEVTIGGTNLNLVNQSGGGDGSEFVPLTDIISTYNLASEEAIIQCDPDIRIQLTSNSEVEFVINVNTEYEENLNSQFTYFTSPADFQIKATDDFGTTIDVFASSSSPSILRLYYNIPENVSLPDIGISNFQILVKT